VLGLVLTGDGRVVTSGSDGQVLCSPLAGDATPVRVARHDKSVWFLRLLPDGHLVSGGDDGRVYRSRLDGRESVCLAHHERSVSGLFVLGTCVISIGTDATLFVTPMTRPVSSKARPGIFATDLSLTCCQYDDVTRAIVAGDGTGNLHVLSFDERAFVTTSVSNSRDNTPP
jgi:hypothetical protein